MVHSQLSIPGRLLWATTNAANPTLLLQHTVVFLEANPKNLLSLANNDAGFTFSAVSTGFLPVVEFTNRLRGHTHATNLLIQNLGVSRFGAPWHLLAYAIVVEPSQVDSLGLAADCPLREFPAVREMFSERQIGLSYHS